MTDEERHDGDGSTRLTVSYGINGKVSAREIDPSESLLDDLRARGFTGAHAGCEHGVCGACTVLVDGEPVRSCIVLSVQVQGAAVETVEGLGTVDRPSDLQQAFSQCRGLQCGFCTPGFLMLATALLRRDPTPDHEAIREAVSSNLCRCTGYHSIVEAIGRVSGTPRSSHDRG
ncbi:(2Fe-2S)-binding protein [Nocardioides caldifontis]|uniref:(2Fe-2S)-binding protein n=1 Tax=Nocardioides caldifontis TaxID=2588938 RepID=UPI001EF0CD1E|nr:(2Fe-2S)-binding protein [Nocardioides caldifontis]